MALGTFCEPVLGNKTTIIANCVGNVVGEIRALGFDGYIHEMAVLRLGEMFIEVGMEGGAAVQIARHAVAMEDELVKEVARFILDDVEVGVVAIAGNKVAVFLVPRGVFDTEVFCHSVALMTSQNWRGRCFLERLDTFDLPSVCRHTVQTIARPLARPLFI